MNRADIIRMAQEAGATISQGHRQGVIVYEDGGNLSPMVIYRFAELVAAAERERCATACEARGERNRIAAGLPNGDRDEFYCADDIRALNDTEGGAA